MTLTVDEIFQGEDGSPSFREKILKKYEREHAAAVSSIRWMIFVRSICRIVFVFPFVGGWVSGVDVFWVFFIFFGIPALIFNFSASLFIAQKERRIFEIEAAILQQR